MPEDVVGQPRRVVYPQPLRQNRPPQVAFDQQRAVGLHPNPAVAGAYQLHDVSDLAQAGAFNAGRRDRFDDPIDGHEAGVGEESQSLGEETLLEDDVGVKEKQPFGAGDGDSAAHRHRRAGVGTRLSIPGTAS